MQEQFLVAVKLYVPLHAPLLHVEAFTGTVGHEQLRVFVKNSPPLHAPLLQFETFTEEHEQLLVAV